MTELDANKKHQRFGHIHQDRFCDQVVDRATQLLPGDGVLPTRWLYKSQRDFVDRYKDLGQALWSKTASYHLLLVNGEYVLRIWTDSPDSAIVDIHDLLARVIMSPVTEIPVSVAKKTRPLTKRTRVTDLSQIDEIIDMTKVLWLGL